MADIFIKQVYVEVYLIFG